MEYIKIPVEITEYDEIGDIISELNPYDDLITLDKELEAGKPIGVSCIGDHGVFRIGELTEKTVDELRVLFGEKSLIFEKDFGFYKRADGTYRMWLGVEIFPSKSEKDVSRSESKLFVIVGISAIVCAVTAVAVTIGLIIKFRKKNQ
jgi:hypothetical protein